MLQFYPHLTTSTSVSPEGTRPTSHEFTTRTPHAATAAPPHPSLTTKSATSTRNPHNIPPPLPPRPYESPAPFLTHPTQSEVDGTMGRGESIPAQTKHTQKPAKEDEDLELEHSLIRRRKGLPLNTLS